jgi:hypothetical protein
LVTIAGKKYRCFAAFLNALSLNPILGRIKPETANTRLPEWLERRKGSVKVAFQGL